ncbi:MAG: exodeoxyribonuclease VII large subunit [Asticcacaulis sp.]|uniref:exodeoxyribonuclease VII large subunit n=1 Tax=Asticcacaulis sp. TaxID=1872648 RepID=UPI003F7C6B2A
MSSDLFVPPDSPSASNAAPYSVSELAGALKRTIEQAYDHVRLRGEISKVTRHASGHVYLTLKDDRAAIDGVIWKGQVPRLQTQPDSGLEVIVTGRITTFPASSKYQIVIEQMEVAGVGALLAQLERIKKKLHAEGLFAPERKRPLPFAPRTIGVITSPTGAVIRDILHRIRDRWPCRVIVWPVLVQGDQAAPQVIRALQGFQSGDVVRPDVLIVARGGGSVEDLWPFNDEALARAVAACAIPVISAVGHETDTTLIDYVSDRRAPTPTGAAEMATPVLSELRAFVADLERRRQTCFGQSMQRRQERVALLARALPRPQELIDAAQQRLDFAGHRLSGGLMANLNAHDTALTRIVARFRPGLLEHPRRLKSDALAQLSQRADRAVTRKLALSASHARLPDLAERMQAAMARALALRGERLGALEQLRVSLDPDRPLNLGFARVNRPDGALVASPQGVNAGDALVLTFKGRETLDVIAGPGGDAPPPPKAKPRPAPAVKPAQGSLF